MRILSSIIGILFIILLVLFSVSNLKTVTVTFWPLPMDVTAPLFIIILGTAITSFLLGALFVWLSDISNIFASHFKQKALTKQLKQQNTSKNAHSQKDNGV